MRLPQCLPRPPLLAVAVFVAGDFVLTPPARAVAAEAVPVEGDEAALQLVLAAVATQRAECSAGGFVKAELQLEGGNLPETDRARVSVLWSGHLGRAEFSLYDSKMRGGEIVGRSWTPLRTVIRANTEVVMYDAFYNRLRVFPGRRSVPGTKIPSVSRAWPAEKWFMEGGSEEPKERYLFDNYFDPANAYYLPKSVAVGAEADGDEIHLTRRLKNGIVVRATAAESAGWNVVRYDTDLGELDRWTTRGTFEWERHPGGRYWVRRLTAQSFDLTTEGPTLTAEFSDFDPDPPGLRRAQFSREALDLPDGTEVVTETPRGAPKRTWVGGRPVRSDLVTDDVLEKLGEALKADSFLTDGEGDDE